MDWRLLEGVPEEAIRRLVAGARRRTFKVGEVLFHEDDPADTMHLIARGRVAVRIITPLGDAATLNILGAGEVVGELGLIGDSGRRVATALALEPVETHAVARDDLHRLRREHPSITEALLVVLAQKLRAISRDVVEALYLPVEKRVLRRVLDLAQIYQDGETQIVIPLGQEEVASLAGTTRATANRVLREAVKRGLLDLGRKRIVVLDEAGLAARAR